MKSFIYILLGIICVILGSVGIITPGLPTTPFILLASWLFVKSNTKLYNYLRNSFYGKYIRKYEEQKGMSRNSKIQAISIMSLMISISIIFLISETTPKIITIIAGLIGVFVVWFLVPNAKKN